MVTATKYGICIYISIYISIRNTQEILAHNF